MDLCGEYGTYLGDICDVKPAICVIIFRRINQYIYKPDWFICVSVWTGIILLRNMDLSWGVIGILCDSNNKLSTNVCLLLGKLVDQNDLD